MRVRFAFLLFTLLLSSRLAGADEVEDWAEALRSAKNESEWRIAQAYLARSGPAAVPHLARLSKTADTKLRERLKGTLALMLCFTTPVDVIRAHETLWTLGANELRIAAIVARDLAGQDKYDTGDLGFLNWDNFPPPTPPRVAVEKLTTLGAFAIPAALELVRDPQPGSRRYGIEILARLGARGQLAALQAVMADQTPIRVDHGCYAEETTVGAEARDELQMLTSYNSRPSAEPEAYLTAIALLQGKSDLVNELRQEARTFEATSWDDFWRRAKPMLAAEWDLHQRRR